MSTQRIPLIKADLPPLESLEESFREILGNGRVTNFGRYVQQFEAEAGAYLGTQAVCLSSATAGLIMTLQALGVPRGTPRRDAELQLRGDGAGGALRGLHAGVRGHRRRRECRPRGPGPRAAEHDRRQRRAPGAHVRVAVPDGRDRRGHQRGARISVARRFRCSTTRRMRSARRTRASESAATASRRSSRRR